MLINLELRKCGLTRQSNALVREWTLSVYIGNETIPERISSCFHPSTYYKGILEGYVPGLAMVKGIPFWEEIIMKAKEQDCQVLHLYRGPLNVIHKKIKRGPIDGLFSSSNVIQEKDYLEVKLSNCSLLNGSSWCNWHILGGLYNFHKGNIPLFEELQKEITDKNLEGVLFIT